MLESVAAILRQMMPDLPMPVTMTRPRHSKQELHGALELAVDPIDQAEDRRRLGAQHLRARSIESAMRSVIGCSRLAGASGRGSCAIAWIRTSLDEQRLEQIERERVLRVALRRRRVARALP